MKSVFFQWAQPQAAPFDAPAGGELMGLLPWPLLAVALSGVLVLFWLWRRRRSAAAAKKSLYGSWHAAIPRYRRSLHRLTAELERARRYHRALTVTVLAVDFDQHKQKKHNLIDLSGDTEIASQFFFSLVSSLLRDNVRGSDLVTYDVTNDFYVLLFPESTATATEQTLRRLQQLVMERSKVMLRYGVAEFPKDGLIIQDLVGRALAKSQRRASEMPPPTDASTNGQKEPHKEPLAQVKM
jgi:GGDEF domain-containing protein